ncbi:asparaginase [Mangrovibrevibacter kandeliae]|uniref:asparaginase n=1 Tax=Mangrovibrevibacter kandeliae TaxID=2968473 RepID=UPI002118C165|nr:asparaginase [Aurantimonas sp. CSK15Z-1]MCQ8780850.1 asparaginase [Aurantimonas sp. CSK15Z-1]
MSNPVLVEVTRGPRVESLHRGAIAVVDAAGAALLAHGDVERPVFPRSAVKVFQGLPLVESGAADAYGFGEKELSLATASHSGEPEHVRLAGDILARAGLDEGRLECGCHWPSNFDVARAMVQRGEEPGQLHNNCSGKHSGFLCTAVHLGEDPTGYVGKDHPVQRRARAAMEDLTGATLGEDVRGTDGCSIPNYAAPLAGFALGFAKLAGGTGVSAERATAGRRLMQAAMAEPWYMSGTGRACVALMQAAPGRVYVKTGAEGVFCGGVPELGLGFALKIDDGAGRASEVAAAATLAFIFAKADPQLAEAYSALAHKTLRNWNKIEVGTIRAKIA